MFLQLGLKGFLQHGNRLVAHLIEVVGQESVGLFSDLVPEL